MKGNLIMNFNPNAKLNINEQKLIRANFLLKPTLYYKLKDMAKENNTSMNDLINLMVEFCILEDDCNV